MRNIAKKLLQQAVEQVGGVVLSKRAFDALRLTRRKAILELVAEAEKGMKPGVTAIVCSKDRALQMYTLLATYFELVKNPAPLVIIYNASTAAHAKAYAQVAKAFEKAPVPVEWVKETTFREAINEVLAKIKTRNMFFLVDDIVLIRPLDLKLAAEIDAYNSILSFRLSPHLRRSYTMNVPQLPPAFKPAPEGKELLEFKWYEAGNEWSYPYSMDGHVFPTAEIRVITRLATFKAPNTYEGALMEFADLAEHRRGLCYRESQILNLPLNRVQNEVENIAGNVSPEYLLEQCN